MPAQHTTTMPWDDARMATLTRLVASGLTAQKIATTMGGGVTKNAIIGKVGRMNLKLKSRQGVRPFEDRVLRPPTLRAPSPPPLRRAPSQIPAQARRPAPPEIPRQAPPSLEPAPSASVAVLVPDVAPWARVTLTQLEPHHCRWPMWGAWDAPGDPKFFCGAARHEPHPYCLGHATIAYQTPTPRRKPQW